VSGRAPERPGARSKARKRAVDLLYEADVRGVDPLRLIADAHARAPIHDVPTLTAASVALVEAVVAHRGEIDALLREHARDWTLERMPAIDRNVLRVGVLELLWSDVWGEPVPPGVALSEAVELAANLSTEDSPRFVNGLLSRIAQDREDRAPAKS